MAGNILSTRMKTIGILFILAFAGLFIGQTEWMGELYEMIGSMAEIFAITAFSVWLFKIAIIQLKKRKFPFLKTIQFTFKLLKQQHIHIGLVGFSAAMAHGSYFFLQTSEDAGSIYSGLFALVTFLVLISFGMILNGKKKAEYKKIHQRLAVGFALALAVHLLFG